MGSALAPTRRRGRKQGSRIKAPSARQRVGRESLLPTQPDLLQRRSGRLKCLHQTAAQTTFQIGWYGVFSAAEAFGESKRA